METFSVAMDSRRFLTEETLLQELFARASMITLPRMAHLRPARLKIKSAE